MSPLARRLLALVAMLTMAPAALGAHSGPPYPVVENQTVGRYRLSVWTDPDTTDDRSPAGKFWITIEPASASVAVPADTRASVTVRARDRQQPALRGSASPVRGDVGNQFVAVLLDHEGPYSVRVDVHGPLGDASVETAVDATYDLRPARWLIAVYLLPFLLVAFLWTKLLLRRRAVARRPERRP